MLWLLRCARPRVGIGVWLVLGREGLGKSSYQLLETACVILVGSSFRLASGVIQKAHFSQQFMKDENRAVFATVRVSVCSCLWSFFGLCRERTCRGRELERRTLVERRGKTAQRVAR